MTIRLPTEQRKEEIALATLRLLADAPHESLTTREVARALDISQPALFRHFQSREQLLLAAIARARADLESLAASALGDASGPVPQLRALAQALLGYVERYPGLPRLLFGSVAPAPGPIRAALQQIVSMQRALLAELVRAGQREGSLDSSFAAEHAATLFVGMVQGLVLDWQLAGGKGELLPRLPPLLELWLRAVAVTPRPPDAASGHQAGLSRPPPGDRSASPLRLLDVRPLLAAGQDPLTAILAAAEQLPQGGVLALVAPFRPKPLLALLAGRGHATSDEPLSARCWQVLVVIGGRLAIEDLRDLEPPEPLERVLSVAAKLTLGQVYLARLPRLPRPLLPRLRERGAEFAVVELSDGSALLRLARSS